MGFTCVFKGTPPFARKTLALHESNKPCATCSFSPRCMYPSKFGETDLSNRSICGRAQTLYKKRFVPQQYFNAGFTTIQSVAMGPVVIFGPIRVCCNWKIWKVIGSLIHHGVPAFLTNLQPTSCTTVDLEASFSLPTVSLALLLLLAHGAFWFLRRNLQVKTVSERKGKEHSQLESENQKGKHQEEMSLNSKEQIVTSLKTKTIILEDTLSISLCDIQFDCPTIFYCAIVPILFSSTILNLKSAPSKMIAITTNGPASISSPDFCS